MRDEKHILHLKLVVFIGLFLLAWALFSYTKILYTTYQLEQKQEWFINENNRLEEGNKLLAAEFEYLQSESFLEKAAKEKLGKKKPNEKVFVIHEPQEEFAEILDREEQLKIKLNSLTNEQKWWYYLFGSEQILEDL